MRRYPVTAAAASAATVVVHRGLWVVWAWPWALCVALLPLGLGMHLAWGSNPSAAPVAASGLTLGVVGMCAYTWRAGRARGPLLRGHAVASVAVGGAWLFAALLAGPFTRPVIDLWVAVLLTGGISFNIRHGLRGHGEDGTGRGWDDLAAKVGLAKSRVLDIRSSGATVQATIEADRGAQSSGHITAAAGAITSLVGVPANGFRSTPDPDDAARAQVTIVTKDLLSAPTPWRGLSAPGRSIIEPMDLGVRESGDPLQVQLPGDMRIQRPPLNVLIAGMTQTGKSHVGRIITAEVLSRSDAEMHIVNTVKGAQFLGPFTGHPNLHVYRDLQTAHQGLEALLKRIAERAEHLGQRGLDGWQPGCGLVYEVWLIEEMAAVIPRSRVFVQIAQQCASTGVSVIASGQRVTTESIPSDARKQMGAAIQFGCRKESREQDYAISEGVIKAGAQPWLWGNSRQGYCYAEIPGTDPDLWSAPARTFAAHPDDFRAAVHTPGAFAEQRAEAVASTDARQAFVDRVRELGERGEMLIRPADFLDIRERHGRSAAWVTGMLSKLVEAGTLEPAGHGMYRWPVKESVGAAP